MDNGLFLIQDSQKSMPSWTVAICQIDTMHKVSMNCNTELFIKLLLDCIIWIK